MAYPVELKTVFRAILNRGGLEPFYLDAEEFFALQDKLREHLAAKGKELLCKPSGYMNFLLAGVEVRVKSASNLD